METLNIAIVGYGGMGNYHAERLLALDGFSVVGVFDIKEERLALAKEKDLKAFASHEEVALSKDVDAVIIATPNDSHRKLTEFYSSHKKHVLCEKPAAITAFDYKKMVEAAKANSVILSINQNRRCDEDFLAARQIIEDGLIGDVYKIESRVMGANGIPGDWRTLKECGGGMMLDWGVHLLDQICLLDDTAISSLNCNYSYLLGFEVDDGFSIRLEFESGLSCIVEVDTNCYINLPRWALYGTLGTAQIFDFSQNGKIVVNYDSSVKPTPQPKGNGLTKTMAHRPHSSVREIALPKINIDNDFIYNNFKDICHNKTTQYVKHDEVLKVLSIMEQAKLSALNKTVINNPLKNK